MEDQDSKCVSNHRVFTEMLSFTSLIDGLSGYSLCNYFLFLILCNSMIKSGTFQRNCHFYAVLGFKF